MNLKRILTTGAIALASTGIITTAGPQVALAHHSDVSISATRPCGPDAPWRLTWSARSWEPENGLQWQSQWRAERLAE